MCRNDEDLLEIIIAQIGRVGNTDGVRKIEKSRKNPGKWERLGDRERQNSGKSGTSAAKIGNLGAQIEKKSANRRAEWRKNRDGGSRGGWKIEKKSRKIGKMEKNRENGDGIGADLGDRRGFLGLLAVALILWPGGSGGAAC